MKTRKLLTLILLLSTSYTAYAENAENWERFSDVGAYGLIAFALATPTYKSDWQGLKQAGYSVITASSVGLASKSLIEKERPDKSGDDSFPSNHTANAFAAATTLNIRYGWEVGLPAYSVATLVGIGRVQANKHYWQDVFAGAVLGSLSAWIFTEKIDQNMQIIPSIGKESVGLTVAINW